MRKSILTVALILAIGSTFTSCREYSREQDRLDKESDGKGDLLKAESTKKVKIEQSKADLESAKLEAQTNIEVARGKMEAAKMEAQTKVIQSEASAKATILHAEAEAQANKMVNQSITPLLIEYNKSWKWDGKLPTTSLGSGQNSIINLK